MSAAGNSAGRVRLTDEDVATFGRPGQFAILRGDRPSMYYNVTAAKKLTQLRIAR